jgi:hypothetical protein
MSGDLDYRAETVTYWENSALDSRIYLAEPAPEPILASNDGADGVVADSQENREGELG